ncbi:hypothetical protein K431DRAFT_287898 [Polychaeton citri CBS 116435]|uniref:Uncharacterized protein n=1 Tax=Polychaeton citri CBS 116435 TaxID=1314669 RepID=A0A9P4Q498_9PEZI|nr:hypothetical protein K431DRAFT_287898 [Polychaeton citri CBS 116435]
MAAARFTWHSQAHTPQTQMQTPTSSSARLSGFSCASNPTLHGGWGHPYHTAARQQPRSHQSP